MPQYQPDAPPAVAESSDTDTAAASNAAAPAAATRVRDARPEDAEAILRVVQAAFPRWPAFDIDVPPIDHLRWKMETADGTPATPHTVVEYNGRIECAQLRWLRETEVAGRIFLADGGADLAVHPSMQGRGLARALADYERPRNDERPFFGFDTRASDARVLHLQDFEAATIPLNTWVKPLSLRAVAARRRERGLPRTARAAAALVATRMFPRQTRRFRGRIERLERFDGRADALWEAVRPAIALAAVRDARRLNWRYADPRSGRCGIFALLEGELMLGYIVHKQAGPEGRIVDWLTHPGAPDALAPLLRVAIASLRREGCREITCALPAHHRDEAPLLEAGFEPGPQPLDLQFALSRLDDDNRQHLLKVLDRPNARIHVLQGDFDFA